MELATACAYRKRAFYGADFKALFCLKALFCTIASAALRSSRKLTFFKPSWVRAPLRPPLCMELIDIPLVAASLCTTSWIEQFAMQPLLAA